MRRRKILRAEDMIAFFARRLAVELAIGDYDGVQACAQSIVHWSWHLQEKRGEYAELHEVPKTKGGE